MQATRSDICFLHSISIYHDNGHNVLSHFPFKKTPFSVRLHSVFCSAAASYYAARSPGRDEKSGILMLSGILAPLGAAIFAVSRVLLSFSRCTLCLVLWLLHLISNSRTLPHASCKQSSVFHIQLCPGIHCSIRHNSIHNAQNKKTKKGIGA